MYRAECESGRFVPGSVLEYRLPIGTPSCGPWRMVFNLGTQRGTSGDASISAIERSVKTMLSMCLEHPDARPLNIRRTGIPRIGAGLGGLDWDDVSEALSRVAKDHSIELVVVSRPEDVDCE